MDAFKEIEAEVLVESLEAGDISEDTFIREMKALGFLMEEISYHLSYRFEVGQDDDELKEYEEIDLDSF